MFFGPLLLAMFFPENGSYSVKRIFTACSEKRVFQRPAVFFLSVQLLFQRTGPRSWTANGQRLFRSSSEPRTKLLALERGTWAQRAGTDLPILSENGEPITDNHFLIQLATCHLQQFQRSRSWPVAGQDDRQQTGSYLACCRRELCVRRCFRRIAYPGAAHSRRLPHLIIQDSLPELFNQLRRVVGNENIGI